MTVIQYKCPGCGADLSYDAQTGTLSCSSCGYEGSVHDYEGAETDFDESAAIPGELSHFQENDGRQYHCNNCGAVLITDNDTTATTCSFCGAPMILGDRLAGELAPVKIIPFKITKEQAQAQFRKWCRGGLLTPKGFMTADRIKNITGMYVPYWLYDIHANSSLWAECTHVHSFSRGDWIYTKTDYFDVYREASLDYVKIPADASEKLNDDLMDRLEPFDYSDLKEFQMPYLAGYIAEKYNYAPEALLPRIQNRVHQYAESYMRSTISGYASTMIRSQNTKVDQKEAYYTLLPIWLVCYDYNDSEHNFIMNGQTGKIVGKPPLSIGKAAAWFAGISAGSFILLKLLAFLIGGVLW